MKRPLIFPILVGVIVGWLGQSRASDRTAYTVYRNSATGITERIHIATFNASEADSYNNENCQQAPTLSQQQAMVSVTVETGVRFGAAAERVEKPCAVRGPLVRRGFDFHRRLDGTRWSP